MFSKTKPTARPDVTPVAPIPPLPDLSAQARKPAPAPEPIRAKAASLLAADLTFEGNVIGSGDLQLDGTVRGDIKVGRLTVGETGNVEGSIQADYVEIRGRVVGAVTGKQVKLIGTAFVDGDISHEQLSIDVGAYFQGRCLQSRKSEAPAAVTPSPAPTMTHAAPVGFAAPAPTPTVAAAPKVEPAAKSESAPVDTAQLIELKPASA
jgi:cytoskeletal protein CcmA (bactofilin family)